MGKSKSTHTEPPNVRYEESLGHNSTIGQLCNYLDWILNTYMASLKMEYYEKCIMYKLVVVILY